LVGRDVQAVVVVLVVLALALVYVGYGVSVLESRVEKLERSIIEVGVLIDNGAGVRVETLHLTAGATALEALNRVAVLETKVYPGLGVSVISIDGISKVPENKMYWIFYTWNREKAGWEPIPVGVGKYRLSDGENFAAVYQYVPEYPPKPPERLPRAE